MLTKKLLLHIIEMIPIFCLQNSKFIILISNTEEPFCSPDLSIPSLATMYERMKHALIIVSFRFYIIEQPVELYLYFTMDAFAWPADLVMTLTATVRRAYSKYYY